MGRRIHHRPLIVVFLIVALSTAVFGQPPTPGSARWIEVRFVKNSQPLTCRSFDLEVRSEGRRLLSGKFSKGFEPNLGLEQQSRTLKSLDLRVRCGRDVWVLVGQGFRVVPAVWTFGLELPPYRTEWQIDPETLLTTKWIKYFRLTPNDGGMEGTMYRYCTKAASRDRNGPCFDHW